MASAESTAVSRSPRCLLPSSVCMGLNMSQRVIAKHPAFLWLTFTKILWARTHSALCHCWYVVALSLLRHHYLFSELNFANNWRMKWTATGYTSRRSRLNYDMEHHFTISSTGYSFISSSPTRQNSMRFLENHHTHQVLIEYVQTWQN